MKVIGVQKNNINFTGFEFKNANVKRIFEEKLSKISEQSAENIRKYIKQTSTEDRKVIIQSTNSRMYDTGEYLLFATFSNCDAVVDECCYKKNSLIKFIKKCAAQAGYEPIKIPKSNKKM